MNLPSLIRRSLTSHYAPAACALVLMVASVVVIVYQVEAAR